MTEDTRLYIVQSLTDQIWKRETIFVYLDDAKDHVEFLAHANPGKFFRVVDDEVSDEPAVYKVVQF